MSFFPRHTVEWHIEEPRAFRRLSLSLVEMALVTGVLLRVYRSYALTHRANGWLFFGGTLAFGLLFLLFMTSAHLANFPIQRWAWRAPANGQKPPKRTSQRTPGAGDSSRPAAAGRVVVAAVHPAGAGGVQA